MTGQEIAGPLIVAGSFERTTGMTPEDVAARGGWPEVLHPDDRERSMALLAEVAKGSTVVTTWARYPIRSPMLANVWNNTYSESTRACRWLG